MRLDKYLKVSRLIKRRTIANEACDAGKVSVNGKETRASYDVKVGDVIEITLGSKWILDRESISFMGKTELEKRIFWKLYILLLLVVLFEHEMNGT